MKSSAPTYSRDFRSLMEFEAARAREYYVAAERALAPEDRPSVLRGGGDAADLRRPARADRRAEYRVLDRRLRLSTPRKLYLVGRAWAAGQIASRDDLTWRFERCNRHRRRASPASARASRWRSVASASPCWRASRRSAAAHIPSPTRRPATSSTTASMC